MVLHKKMMQFFLVVVLHFFKIDYIFVFVVVSPKGRVNIE